MTGKVLGWCITLRGGGLHFASHKFELVRDAECACKVLQNNASEHLQAQLFTSQESFESWKVHKIYDVLEESLRYARSQLSISDRNELAKMARKILR